jgi:Domain of unknown function (DUF4352)
MRPALALLALLLLAACSPSEPTPAPATTSATPTYELAPRKVRPDEIALRLPPQNDGDTEFVLIGLTNALPTLTGSHIDFNAKGLFYRIRVVVTNNGRTNVDFDTRKQLLITQDGATHIPDDPAMTVKRQPDQFVLGAGVRVEFDLYYDIPADAKLKALRVFGGRTLTDQDDTEGTDMAIPS